MVLPAAGFPARRRISRFWFMQRVAAKGFARNPAYTDLYRITPALKAG